MTIALVFALAGYLLGAIPFGYLIGKHHGIEILDEGSGNIGATNLGRVLKAHGVRRAWLWGKLCLLLDVGKGFFPIWLYLSLSKDINWAAVVALATVAGHLWTPLLGFRGGKGVATTLGVILALNWMVALGCLALAEIIKFFYKRHHERVAISSTVGVWTAALAMICLSLIGSAPAVYGVIATLLAAIITFKHSDNYKRIRQLA